MEIKEIIEYLEKGKPRPLFARSRKDYDEYIGKEIEKIDKMINLVKSLEIENKAYKEMWDDLDNFINIFHKETTGPILKDIRAILIKLKEEYLGGGE
jgi:hypothetical protein